MVTYNKHMERLGYGLTLIGVFSLIGLPMIFFLVARFDGEWTWPEIATLVAMPGAVLLAAGGVRLRKRSGAVVSPDLRPDGTPHPPRDNLRDAIMIGVAVTAGSFLAMMVFPDSDRNYGLYLAIGLGIVGCGIFGKFRSGRE